MSTRVRGRVGNDQSGTPRFPLSQQTFNPPTSPQALSCIDLMEIPATPAERWVFQKMTAERGLI